MRKYLLFDLDGTLIDSFDGVSRSYAYALDKMGIPLSDPRALRRVIGPPLSESFREYYGLTGERNAEAIAHYREYYLKHNAVLACTLYDGVADALRRLRQLGYRISLATSKPLRMAMLILEKKGLLELFDFVGGADDSVGRSEKSDVIRYVLSSLEGASASSSLMIGDRKYDTLGAASLGIDTLGVLWGFGDSTELLETGAVALAESPDELVSILSIPAEEKHEKGYTTNL